MFCTKKIKDDLIWVGANDRRLAMFEGVYSVPHGVSYNSYLLLDDKTVLFDTVDKAVQHRFFENLAETLGGRGLDYLVVHHMEPDHSAVIEDLIRRYPDMRIVCNTKSLAFIKQFFDFDIDSRAYVVAEKDIIETGHHTLQFFMAPMVHWPEVMITYDLADKILFSADAFGSFGAVNGAIFADEVDFDHDYMDEARRYYTNIVGKYGTQVKSLLSKAADLDIEMICPLHGFVWRKNLNDIISKYELWSSYTPEESGVMIAYASVYGNTENTAEILSARLRDRGIKTVMYDVSVTPPSEIIAAAFRWSHLVFASTTYNAGIFVTMEALIRDLTAHNIQNRTVGIIENGSWAPASGSLIRKELEACKDMNILSEVFSLKSSLKREQLSNLDAMVEALAASMSKVIGSTGHLNAPEEPGKVDSKSMFKLSYGLFVLTAKDGDKDNGCIVNTVMQLTDKPLRVSVTVNKANLTCDMIAKTKTFNVSILTESASFHIFERFGFHSGKEADKFAGYEASERSANGLLYLTEATNAVISANVTQVIDCGTHMLFIADVTETFTLSDEPSVTYQYYFAHIKPSPKMPEDKKKGFVCKICGYVYEGDSLPEDFICPICKHGVDDFEPVG